MKNYSQNSGDRFFRFILIGLVLFFGYFTYRIIKPFFTPIGWAIVFSILLYPVYALLVVKLRFKALASLITVILIVIIIFGPFSYMGYLFVYEVKALVDKFAAGGGNIELKSLIEHPKVLQFISRLQSVLPVKGINLEQIIFQNLQSLRSFLLLQITVGAKNLLQFFFDIFLLLFTSFFLLRDGKEFTTRINNYLPFAGKHKERLKKQVVDMVISTIYGGIIIAAMQGAIAGLTFWILGAEAPVLLGAATFFASFVPAVGTMVVWGPATIVFMLLGHLWKGIAMFAVGVFVISTVDNLLKPVIISGRTKMHTLLIFFSVLGGINVFGLIGLVLGPLTLALFISIMQIFGEIEGGTDADA